MHTSGQPLAPVTLTDAYSHYLDELSWFHAHAQHMPLGLADPDQPHTGWSYTLPGDPGHLGEIECNHPTEWIHQALIALWSRDQNRLAGRFFWRVTWTASAGWVDRWFARIAPNPWQPYVSDFFMDHLTIMTKGT